MSFWDDPAIQPPDGNFFKFENVGDSITGRILTMTRKQFSNDKGGTDTVPQLVLATPQGEEITVTCGAVVLIKRLIEARPEVGDDVRMTYVGKDGKTKIFTVDVRRNGAAPATAPAPAPAAAAASAGGFSDDPPF